MTKKQILRSFFECYPQFKSEFRVMKQQNGYSCDCRAAFCYYVDYLSKNGEITETQANNTTLNFSTNLFKK